MVPRRVDLLNVSESPIRDSVQIPIGELPTRLHELPRPTSPLRIYDPYEAVVDTADLQGRDYELVSDVEFGEAERCRLWEYNSMLDALGAPGKALDLGCGSGRDAVALACIGWEVTACDHLPKSLAMAANLESRYSDGPPIEWLAHDLREGAPSGSYDLVTSFFAWKPEAIVSASWALRPGGCVMVEMFTFTDQAKHGKPKHPTDSEEISRLFAHLREVTLDEDWRHRRHTVRYIGVRD